MAKKIVLSKPLEPDQAHDLLSKLSENSPTQLLDDNKTFIHVSPGDARIIKAFARRKKITVANESEMHG